MLYRGFWVWGIGTIVVLGVFLIFVAAGWPGTINSCTQPTHDRPPKPDSCYCEQFSRIAITRNEGGVRQPVNTWFNLYSIATSFVVAMVVYFDRKAGNTTPPIKSDSLIPDLYIFAVLFLGLGSMWFHASLKAWGGILDELSMYTYASFLIFYSMRRLWDAEWFFWIGYAITVIGFTIWGALWEWEYTSLVLILILVVAYLAVETAICFRDHSFMQGKPQTIALWLAAVAAIIAATIFWTLSQTGGPMCDPTSAFQPHGLLWHPLAGVMAVLLYFYWREDDSAA